MVVEAAATATLTRPAALVVISNDTDLPIAVLAKSDAVTGTAAPSPAAAPTA